MDTTLESKLAQQASELDKLKRELRIEAALERVRTRCMEMTDGEELGDVAALLFSQLSDPGFLPHPARIYFSIIDPDKHRCEVWMTRADGSVRPGRHYTPLDKYQGLIDYMKAFQAGKPLIVRDMSGDELSAYLAFVAGLPHAAEDMDYQRLFASPPERVVMTDATFTHGTVGVMTHKPLNTEASGLLMRVARTFQIVYTRFLDLQKAEAQAREAQIEAALERVSSRTMAMRRGEELADTAMLLFEQLISLDFEPRACGFLIMDEESQTMEDWSANLDEHGKGSLITGTLAFDQHPILAQVVETWRSGDPYFIGGIEDQEELKSYYEEVTSRESATENIKEKVLAVATSEWTNSFNFEYGMMYVLTPDPIVDEEIKIMMRFAGVFKGTYRRFLDLQKAEAQARESEIQLAMERVRARSMAMHKSDELADLSLELVKQVHALGIDTWFCAFNIYDDDPKGSLEWGSNGQGTFPQYRTPREGIFLRYYEAGQRGETLLVNEIGEKECPAHYDYLCSLPGVGEQLLKMKDAGIPFPTSQIDHVAYFKYGYIIFITFEPAHEAHDIFKRFARVFEQTYTRFLDLQRVEAQAREAQIEAALEKVRSRSLAMHKSDELNEVVSILFEKLKELQIPATAVGICIPIDGSKDLNTFVCGENKEGLVITNYRLPYFDNEIPKDLNKAIERQLEFFVGHYSKEEKDSFYEYVIEHIAEFRHLPEDIKRMIFDSPTYTISTVAVKNALFNINDFEGKGLGENEVDVIKRFARVFDQAYTRFQDLQKAEAQTREAKIEAALEKVRSRTMGMQSSEELPEVANLLFLEVQALGIPAWSCGYNILSEDKTSSTCIMSSEGELQTPFTLPLTEHVSLQPWHQAIVNDEEFFVYAQGGEDLAEHYMYMKSLPELRSVFQQFEDAGISLPTYQVNHLARFTHGFLLFITYEPVPGAHDIFKRFTHVFEQTYTRFLDLKKAETQAREAQIENALEKVRSRSLSMQKPEELIDVAQLLREEMGALGVEELETSSIYIHDEGSGTTQCWFTIKKTDDPGRAVTDQMTIDLQDTWVGRQMHAFYHSPAKKTSIVMQGDHRIEWIRYCEEKSNLFSSGNFYGETIPERTYHLYKFSNGYIGAAAPGEISRESWDLLKRATAVFSFAYTRFRDLQAAEASARASLRQASLDRVRADISSMRNAEDLDRITPLIFNELTTLGIPFIRCGVFIVHEKRKSLEVYLSTPEGKSLAAMNLAFDANVLTERSVDAWKKEEVYVEHWNQADFLNWGRSLVEQGHIKDLKTYQGAEAPPQSLHLYFIPFTQGLLYVGSTGTLDAEQIDLVKALARAFDIAYARYEDFVRLEQAKVEVESAMSELKATQSQLVQQEKLASLGQLTAGIAHEIKNPLNFVNNFSEVSLELIDEALEEIQKAQKHGHTAETADLLSDIKSNLGKIHEHGTRANGIVTSMLQHSRGGSGKMEPTDLNALIKEYVNLCFHGMRASKNPINVDIQLNLDPPVGMVSLIKEDFARVIINICNNAFDAMRSKLSDPSQKSGYTPKLTVHTRRDANHVLIEITDNGPGIPDDIKDKILQPFFTTKKGTQGTGLGLSITNDIVKAHGGELKLESEEGTGSIFIIHLATDST